MSEKYGVDELIDKLNQTDSTWSFVSIADSGIDEYQISDMPKESEYETMYIVTAPENAYKRERMQATACIAEFCVKAGIIDKGSTIMIIGGDDTDKTLSICDKACLLYDGQGLFETDAILDPKSFSWQHKTLTWTRGWDGLGEKIAGELSSYRAYLAREYKKYMITERFSAISSRWWKQEQYQDVYQTIMNFSFQKLDEDALPSASLSKTDLSMDAKWLVEHIRFDGFANILEQCDGMGTLSLETVLNIIELMSSYATNYNFSIGIGSDEDLEKALESGMAESIETLLLGVPLEDILA